MKSIRIECDIFLIVVLFFSFVTGFIKEFAICYACMTLHELGHALAALLTGARIFILKLLPVGLNAQIEENTLNDKKKFFIYFCGPALNFILFIVFLVINSYFLVNSESMRFFIYTNIFLFIFNIVPVLPLDGGRIARLLISEKAGFIVANNLIYKFSIFVSSIFVIAGSILILLKPHNSSLLLVGLYIVLVLKSDAKEASFMNIKNVIYRRSRLLKRGIYPARDLVVVKTAQLGEIIKNMDFDRFHIIYVLDDDLKICGVYTEQEVIDNLLKYNIELTFGELVEQTKPSCPL